MKSIVKQSAALLVVLIAASFAQAESIMDKKIAGGQRLYDKMLESKVDQNELKKALTYFDANQSKFTNQRYIVLIDYGIRSKDERFFMFDTQTGQWAKYLVAHGRGSGGAVAAKFSNKNESKMTSLGFYKTAETYSGKHGYSLRLDGLSSTNSNARKRAIVIHSANYVTQEWANSRDMVGRSEGCPALDPRVSKKIISLIKEGAMIYAFN
jgi:hypothetical protein